ncbi:hypothetical protein ABVY18_004146 [Vibrio parahaemolyticus]|nr:hypothetical protein [Vibrio parahaemolyticus]EGR3062778.1 hypothetical protein [Vibrio parahaemolyticus]EGR3072925.1 hypothetical protein [Vibrio parahaemolyticus]EGR3174417.1 hypothetical protein [Vibrio parahaemolyticus]EJC6906641.1 hypothetical protein [Vibrio parahaemolyticus]
MFNNVPKHYPEVWYGGNRYMESDWGFIAKHLACLSEEKQKFVSDVYENIYRHHFNQKKYRDARLFANKFLQDYTRDNWDVNPQLEKVENPKQERINQVRQAQKDSKKKINLDR